MSQWKKIITSGSNAALNNITTNNINASGLLSFSSSETSDGTYKFLVQDTNDGRVYYTGSAGGGGSSVATLITLGQATTGNNNFTSNTSVQDAIDDIDTILGLLAPAKPSNLSAVSLDFYNTAPFSAKDKDLNSVDNIITDTTPQFEAEDFYNGDSGILTAQLDDAYDSTDENFTTLGTITLTTDSNVGTNGDLQIISDTDPYAGQTGKKDFYTQLTARINLSGLTANSVGDYTKHKVLLNHSETGNASKEFTVDSNPATIVSNLVLTYNESINGSHYQSGIKYLGDSSTISASYDVRISSNANFINSSRKLASVTSNGGVFGTVTRYAHSSNAWAPSQSYSIIQSVGVTNNRFRKGDQDFYGKNYKADDSNTNTTNVTTTVENLLVDSKQEDETKPHNGNDYPLRVKSGNGLYPSFGTSTGDFGDDFSPSTSLTAANEYELQFTNEYFHWPSSTNYSNYIPAGPDYSGISSLGDGDNGLRYVTFNLGTISNAGTVTLTFENCIGFDNALIQTEDNFQLQLIVVSGGTAVTGWIDGNAQFSGAGNTVDRDGMGGIAPDGNSSGGNNHDFVRVITFGNVVRSGTVYVRVGWDSGAGTSATNTTARKFKYITKS